MEHIKDLRNYFLANNGALFFDYALKVINTFSSLEDLKKQLPINTRSLPRIVFLESLFSKKKHLFPSDAIVDHSPLYTLAENIELLRNIFPGLIDSSSNPEECLLYHDFEHTIENRRLLRFLSTNHPLYLELHKNKIVLDYLRSFFDVLKIMEGTGSSSCHLHDQGLKLIAKCIRGWFLMTISLSGAYYRHCKRCKRCSLDVPVPGFIEISEAVRHENFEALPAFIKKCMKEMEKVALRIKEFKQCENEDPLGQKFGIDRAMESALKLEALLKSPVKEKRALTQWWTTALSYALGDIIRFFNEMASIIEEFEYAFERLDSAELKKKGLVLVKSITIEEIYDQKQNGTNHLIHALDAFYGSKRGKDSWETLAKFRHNLKKPEYKIPHQENGLDIKKLLSRLYHDLYGKYMNMPVSIKKGLLAKTIQNLQTRLSLHHAAELLDAYSGRFRSVWQPIDAIFLLPFFATCSLQSLGGLWLPVSAGFTAAIIFKNFQWYLLGLLFYFIGVALKLFTSSSDIRLGFVSFRHLIWSQFMPEFLLPIILSLTPFVLSEELKSFVFTKIDNPIEFFTWILFFALFSLLALAKLQSHLQEERLKNAFSLFGFLWSLSLFFAMLMPLVLHNTEFNIENSITELWGIPRVVTLFEIANEKYLFFPAASLVFSFICLFVAIFLEGLYRKEG